MRPIDADELKTAFPCGEYVRTESVRATIDSMPTMEAKPVKHGHWIECESENGIHFHKCSECGRRDMYQGTFTDWGGRGFSFYFKRTYCPVCGSTMDTKED